MDLYCHLHPCSPPARLSNLSLPPWLLSAERAALFSGLAVDTGARCTDTTESIL